MMSNDFALPAAVETDSLSEQVGQDLLMEIPLSISAELGRTHMSARQVLALQSGSLLPLDRVPGQEVDIFVNSRLMARGEVVLVDDRYAVRITEIVTAGGRDAPG